MFVLLIGGLAYAVVRDLVKDRRVRRISKRWEIPPETVSLIDDEWGRFPEHELRAAWGEFVNDQGTASWTIALAKVVERLRERKTKQA